MDERHVRMWTLVEQPEQVLEAIRSSPGWDERARSFAVPGND